MRFARLTEVWSTSFRKFFNSDDFRFSVGLTGFFLGHRRVGYFHVGRDCHYPSGHVIAGGCGARLDAARGEIWCRRSFRWSTVDLPGLIWLRDPDMSTAWTGREYRLLGYRWGNHNRVCWP